MANISYCRSGEIVEYRQDIVPKSQYQTQLEEEFGGEEPSTQSLHSHEGSLSIRPTKSTVRYWSDYSRVALHPRSVQRLPDVPEYDNTDGDWTLSGETFQRYDEVSVHPVTSLLALI